MRSTTQNTKTPPKKADRIPFEEMCRLMRVYGPIKSFRKRQNSGVGKMKTDSVKRKFYRWFPDLEDRFARDDAGYFRPKFGHEFEMKYRQDLRTKDGETLSKKRTRCRNRRDSAKAARSGDMKQNCVPVSPKSTASSALIKQNCVSTASRRIVSPQTSFGYPSPNNSTLASPPEVLSAPFVLRQELTGRELSAKLGLELSAKLGLELDCNHKATASIIADNEPMDDSFLAERDIFDNVEKGLFEDVETSFYGSYNSSSSGDSDSTPSIDLPFVREDRPRLVSLSSSNSSGSEEDQASAKQWESDSSIDDMLDKSMEEYCEEILASDGNDSAPGFRFGVL